MDENEVLEDEKIELRPVVRRFAEEMEQVLRNNDHKSGWEKIQPLHLLWTLKTETSELVEALIIAEHERRYPYDPDFDKVIKEVCDIANYTAFLLYILEKKEEERYKKVHGK